MKTRLAKRSLIVPFTKLYKHFSSEHYSGLHEDHKIVKHLSIRDAFKKNNGKKFGISLVVKCRLHEKQNKVYCCVTFWYSTWGEVPARTDTLVGQPSYHVRQAWGEVVPEVLSLLVVRLMLVSE